MFVLILFKKRDYNFIKSLLTSSFFHKLKLAHVDCAMNIKYTQTHTYTDIPTPTCTNLHTQIFTHIHTQTYLHRNGHLYKHTHILQQTCLILTKTQPLY